MSKLEVKNLKKSFGGLLVLDGVDFEMSEEIISIAGISGCGKSTLFNIIAGNLKADGGDILLDGKSILNTMGSVGYMMQDDLLIPWKTVAENTALPLILSGVDKADALKKAGGYFEMFGLVGFEKKYPHSLSGGMRQRAALLRTYMMDKKLNLFDEPFAKLDFITKNNIRTWFLKTLSDFKISAIFVTHDIEEAILVSGRVYLMSDKPAKISRIFDVSGVKKDISDAGFNEVKKEILASL